MAHTIKCPQCEAQTDKVSEGNQGNDFHLLNKQILIIYPTDYDSRLIWSLEINGFLIET